MSTYKILRRSQVLESLGISSSTLDRRINDGLFPPPVPISLRSRGWPEHEVQAILRNVIGGSEGEALRSTVSDLISKRVLYNPSESQLR